MIGRHTNSTTSLTVPSGKRVVDIAFDTRWLGTKLGLGVSRTCSARNATPRSRFPVVSLRKQMSFPRLSSLKPSGSSLSAYVALSTTSAVFEDGATIYGYLTSSGFNLVDTQTSFAHSILVYNATAGNKEDPASPIYSDAAHNFTDCAPVDAGSPSAGAYVEALSAFANLTETPTIQAQCVGLLGSI